MLLPGRRPNALSPRLALTLALATAFALAGGRSVRADEPPAPKDDALDRLLEKLDEASAPPKAKSDDASAKDKDKDKDKDQKPSAEKADGPGTPAKAEDEKAGGDVAAKDKALDSLLEKLGETGDRPDAQDERRGPPKPGDGEDKDKDKSRGAGKEPMPPKADQPAPDELGGKDKTIDERLEELTGRKKKKREQDDEGGSPLSQVIKEMREVEQRLGKTDTGEETRKKQSEIVRNLDQLLEQLRNASSESQSQRRARMMAQAGQKPGSQPGQTPGANAGGAPSMKPAKPEHHHPKVGSKDEWGHLPPELQQERASAADEEMLTAKQELIKLYYLNVSRKSLAREK